MTELSTAPTTSPANWNSDGKVPPLSGGATPVAPATATAATVLDGLDAAGWKSLHHRETAEKRPLQIDHLAVGPGGIFVIDAHSWTPTTDAADQNAALSAVGALANSIRTLLPPLTRQYVVPLMTYLDASPMSMLRGSIQICTTSMLQGVITSRRPVLSASEIDDVVASLSSGLRTSSRAAASGSSSSATPSRRGFLRKNPRNDSSASVAPEPPTPVAEPTPVIEPVPVVAAAAVVEPAPVVEPTFVPAAADEPTSIVEPAAEPTPVAEPALEPAAFEPSPVEPAPVVEEDYWPQVDPPAEPEAVSTAIAASPVEADDEVADLAYPVVPADSTWDLTAAPASLSEPGDDPAYAPTAVTAPAVVVESEGEPQQLESQPHFEPEPLVEAATVTETIQPSSPPVAAPATAPTPRQPGGRRKAPVAKSGMGRLLPNRATGRAGRRVATTPSSTDGDSSQEGDLDRSALSDDLTPEVDAPLDIAVAPDEHVAPAEPETPAFDPETAVPSVPTVVVHDDSPAQPEPDAEAPAPVASTPELDAEPAAIAAPIVDAEPAPEPVATAADEPVIEDWYEPTMSAVAASYEGYDPSSVEPYDFAELDEPLPTRTVAPQLEPVDDEPEASQKSRKIKEPKKPKKPRLRRSKDEEVDGEADIDLSQMPANLSERGRQMYVELQRRPKIDPTPAATAHPAQSGRAGALRKLFVFCVIGGAIGISSSHYDEINDWVSTHVEHLPGLNKIEGPPQPEQPKKAKKANTDKAKQDKGSQGNKQQ